jgi:hypothetical protein
MESLQPFSAIELGPVIFKTEGRGKSMDALTGVDET